MEKQTYEKPEMKFVALRNQDAVANKCWGIHDTNEHYSYDYSGQGYITFTIIGNSCSAEYSTICPTYINVPEEEKAAALQELLNVISQQDGSSAQPWKGSLVIPGDPDPSWS